MDKKNLKKAALLGLMIGAAVVSAPVVAHEPVTSQGMTLAHSCAGGCGAKKGGNIANADEPATEMTAPGTGHSCSGNMAPQGTRKAPQASCSGTSAPQGSCSGAARPRTNGY